MASNSFELNLSLKPAYTPKTVRSLLKDISSIENDSKKLLVLGGYLQAHQEELSKVRASPQSGELPQCMLLLMEAIVTLKEEMTKVKVRMESKGSLGQTLLMEFLPTKGNNHEEGGQRKIVTKKWSSEVNDILCPSPQNQIEIQSHEKKHKSLLNSNQGQQTPNLDSAISCKTRNGMETQLLFMTTKGYSCVNSGQMGQGDLNLRTDSQTQYYHPEPLKQSDSKNKRRAWSIELHKRFVDALNLLGGIDEATPKQIKDLMQVEGLTNDQVKSHLQKFRLHYRRLPEHTYPAKQSAYKQNYLTSLRYNSEFWKPRTPHPYLPQLGHSHELLGGGQSSKNIDMGSKEGRFI